MAIFRFSTAAAGQGFGNKLFGTSNAFNDSQTKIAIYKGALPTKNDLDTTDPDALRLSDRLIQFVVGGNKFTIDSANNTATLNTSINAAAANSGTATWFLLHEADHTTCPQIVGSVSAPGGGGDLVVGNTTITSGLQYSLGSLIYSQSRNFS